MMGKTRIEELCYELYGSSKQHDSWQRYAMVRELRELMKRPKASGSERFERSGDEKQLPVIDDETDLLGTGTIVDPTTEICEKLVHKAILEEKSTSQFQVPVSASENFRSNELGKSDSELEKLDHVVLNENLELECDQKNAKKKTDVDGEVESDQKMISDTKTSCAHKVLVKMPSKEKRMKHLKAWKFKFKSTTKRSKSRDVRFFSAEEIAWFRKDSKEIYWGCVNKKFKEVVAACGKTRVDRFKLVHATPRPLQSSVWDRGGSLLECVGEESFGKDKIKEWLFKVEEFFSIDFTPMELKVKLVSNPFDGDAANWHLSQVQTGQFGHLLTYWGAYKVLLKERFENVLEDSIAEMKQLQETKEVEDEIEPVIAKEMLVMPQIAVNANLGFSDYNNKRMKGKTELLATSQKMQKMEFFSFGIHTEMEENVEFVGYKAHGRELLVVGVKQLILAATKFYLKHKWRSRLLQSIPELKQRIITSLWKSLGYLMEDMMEEDQKQLGDSELLVIVRECVETRGGVGMDKKPFPLSLRNNRIWDPGG